MELKSGMKVFTGKPAEIERAFNGWANDGTPRALVSITPLHVAAGDVGFAIVFNTPAKAIPATVVPTNARAN